MPVWEGSKELEMGAYIEVPQHKNKAQQILDIHGGEDVSGAVPALSDIPRDKALICVAENGLFDVAAWVYDRREFAEFQYPDGRPKRWLLIDRDIAIGETGYNPGSGRI